METSYVELDRQQRTLRSIEERRHTSGNVPRKSTPEDLEREARAQRDVLIGGLWCVGGIALTAVGYLQASQGGGGYVFAWGAIIFGFAQMMRGLTAK
jgi:hypothetical protein